MFTNKLIVLSALILFLLMQSLGFGQTRYSDYSKNPLTLYELGLVGKLLPKVAEQIAIINSYEKEVSLLRGIIEINKQEIEQLNLKNEGLNELLDISKSKWWQEPFMIVGYIIVSFVVGVLVIL